MAFMMKSCGKLEVYQPGKIASRFLIRYHLQRWYLRSNYKYFASMVVFLLLYSAFPI